MHFWVLSYGGQDTKWEYFEGYEDFEDMFWVIAKLYYFFGSF